MRSNVSIRSWSFERTQDKMWGKEKKKMLAPPQSGEHCVTMETALTSEQALCDYS